MVKANSVESITRQYRNGQMYFTNLELENECFDGLNLEGIVFDQCSIYSTFRGANLRNARFINGGIKTSDFREADLTNAHFENLAVEHSIFVSAKTEGLFFDNNWAYGQKVTWADFNAWLKDYER